MASGGILQTPTRLSAIALGRSDVALINALNRSGKFWSAAEGLKCRALRRRLGNPSSLQGFGPHHTITLEIPLGRSFGRSGARHSREHKNKRNSSAGDGSQKGYACMRATCEELLAIGGSI
jgi:hypothetical protein